jgi:hypothetical protein
MMQRRMGRIALVVVACLVLAAGAQAELFSKSYAFRANTKLEVGTEMPGGLRLDAVEFLLSKEDESDSSTFGGPKARVSVSNLGKTSVTIAIAIAVMNADGRLVGVASGGTKLFPLRAERQMSYTLDFGGVRSELANGAVFHVTIELKP